MFGLNENSHASPQSYLECVVPAHGPVGVGAAHEEAPLVQLRDDADVVLALGLKRRDDSRS